MTQLVIAAETPGRRYGEFYSRDRGTTTLQMRQAGGDSLTGGKEEEA
jgi:hypothetical protein